MKIIDSYTRQILNIANDQRHGYSQKNRWGPDFDCSSLVITVVDRAGLPVKDAGATYTGNLKKAFLECGFIDVIDEVDISNSRDLKKGDILLKQFSHCEIYIGCGLVVGATIDEDGGVVGAKSGDQTGEEIRSTDYYNNGWTSVLRYNFSR